MSNSLYHKHNGPILMSQMANYYHLFTDVLPLHWKPLLLNPQVLNLSVKFSGDFLAQRGNLIMPENVLNILYKFNY